MSTLPGDNRRTVLSWAFLRHIAGLVVLFGVWPSPAYAKDPPLPNVLVIGDSLYSHPVRSIATSLKDKARVVFPAIQPGEVRHSTVVLQQLDRYLGDEKWEVIVCTVGLLDLIHRAPGMESFRLMAPHAGGVRTTSPEQYEQNLRRLVHRLKQTNATLIWASTPPIGTNLYSLFTPGSEVEYNAIAEKIMRAEGVSIVDLHAHITEAHGSKPANTPQEIKPALLEAPLVEAITAALPLQ